MKEFTKLFSVEGSILYEYPAGELSKVIAYIFRPTADLSSL